MGMSLEADKQTGLVAPCYHERAVYIGEGSVTVMEKRINARPRMNFPSKDDLAGICQGSAHLKGPKVQMMLRATSATPFRSALTVSS